MILKCSLHWWGWKGRGTEVPVKLEAAAGKLPGRNGEGREGRTAFLFQRNCSDGLAENDVDGRRTGCSVTRGPTGLQAD